MRRLLGAIVGTLGLLAALAATEAPDLGYRVDADWPSLPSGTHFAEVSAAAVDDDGNIYIFHRGEEPVMVFSREGKLLRSFGKGLFDSPHGLRIDPEGNLWAADSGSHIVVKLSPQGRVLMVLGRRGQPDLAKERFDRPTDVAFSANGDVYIADGYGNSRVVKYSKDGDYLGEWGKKGVDKGEFNTPHGIITGKAGRVYVADRENFRIQIFDADGKFLEQWKHVGSPFGFAMSDDGFLFMADGYNDRVLKLDPDNWRSARAATARSSAPSAATAAPPADSTSSITWRSARAAVSTPPRSLLSAYSASPHARGSRAGRFQVSDPAADGAGRRKAADLEHGDPRRGVNGGAGESSGRSEARRPRSNRLRLR